MIDSIIKIKRQITSSVIAVIDISNINITCLVYRVYEDKQYNLLGINSVIARGFENGDIVNLEQALDSLSNLMIAAEDNTKARISNIILSIPDEQIKLRTYPYFSNINQEITKDHLIKIKDINNYQNIINSRDIVVSAQYSDIYLDNKKVENPIGIYAGSLKTNIIIAISPEVFVVNILKVFNHLSLEVILMIPNYLGFMNLLDCDNNNLFIDIRASSSSLLVIKDNKFAYHKLLNKGLDEIFRKMASELSVNLDSFINSRDIYSIHFTELRGKTLEFKVADDLIKIHNKDFYTVLSKVMSSFFNLIMLELEKIGVKQFNRVNVFTECNDLLELCDNFPKELLNYNEKLENLIQDRHGVSYPLGALRNVGIMKYYISNFKIDNNLKVLSKKLKDILY